MIEVSSNPATARAFQRAHIERSRVINRALNWLFGSR